MIAAPKDSLLLAIPSSCTSNPKPSIQVVDPSSQPKQLSIQAPQSSIAVA